MTVARSLRGMILLIGVAGCKAKAPPSGLEPLSAGEIARAAEVLRSAGLLGDSVAVLSLALDEPSKDSLPEWAGRRAEAQLFDHVNEVVTRAVVDLHEDRIVSEQQLHGVTPPFTYLDRGVANRLLRSDAQWRRALERRTLRPSEVTLVMMGPGALDSMHPQVAHRFLRVTAALRSSASPFASPIEGMSALIDLTDRRVVEVRDIGAEPPPIAPLDTLAFTGAALEPLPGPSGRAMYRIDGHSVSWLGWRFDFALHPREGLVLYQVRHAGRDGVARSVLARASVAEMLVPYGDPSAGWRFRNVFDVGEYGLGVTAAALVAGQDVPRGATTLDAVLADQRGLAKVYQRVIGIYERDGGLRWRHGEQAARSRELVIRFVTTVGNYDYGFSWVFNPDGVLAVEIDLTGMMQVKGVHGEDSRFGTLVAPYLSAIHHQHFFGFRLDFDVGERTNRVREIEMMPLPVSDSNPLGTGFALQSSVLQSERAARRNPAHAQSRAWVIESGSGTQPVGYQLSPGPLPDLLGAAGSSVWRRGEFATHALWVTALDPQERYPAGDFPGQAAGGDGLPRYQADDEPLDGTDLVVWYTAGMTHVPSPAEWPIMPVNRLRFELRPTGASAAQP